VNRQADDKFLEFGDLLPINLSEITILIPWMVIEEREND
jgi:hypothetical protein